MEGIYPLTVTLTEKEAILNSNTFNVDNTSYEYDYLNQLTRDNNSKSGKTTTYNYDNGGNILSKTTYDYTTGSLDGLTGTVVQYTYGDTNWKDKLTAYNGNAITYDSIGNPINYYNGTTFEWSGGRQLARATKQDGTYMSYRYNDSGVRIRKSVNGVATDYLVDGTNIIAEKTGNNTIWYYYDAAGLRVGFTYNSTPYYYIYNAQGDVIGIYNSGQQIVALYNYDAWGKIISVTDGSGAEITDQNHIAHINPFRYRGYYYDTETGLYLTGTRYYDPEIGRFINADGQINDDILGTNLFAYCGNNPVTRADDTGRGWWVVAGALIGGIAGGVTKIVSNVTTGKKWNEGVIGAVVGGAVYGGVLAATGSVCAAGFASAAAESLTNEVVSYIPKVSQANGQTVTKKVTTGNVIDSAKTVLNDTAVNGTISAITGKIAKNIVPTNNGWFEPQKFVSSFVGKYAIKSELQTLTQSALIFGYNGFEYSVNQRFKQGQQPIVTFFPDTEIRAAR
ncbi:MAG: RHS repeat-associated core domain-containing protein [Clostridia bacterium]|nr:RHS repeat-associated core domain-containing protein [Clostridia bacterium]